MQQWFGIRFKIVAGILLLCLLPLIVLWYILLEAGRSSIIHSTGESMMAQASIMRQRLEYLNAAARKSALWLASQSEVRAVSSGLADNNKTYQALSGLFRSFSASSDSISVIFLLHPETGEVLASSGLTYKGKFFDKKPYFPAAKETLAIHIAPDSRNLEKNLLEMALPVRGPGEKTVAVLAVRVSSDRLRASLKSGNGINAYFSGQSRPLATGQSNGKATPIVTETAEPGLSGKPVSGVFINTTGEKVIRASTPIESLGLELVLERPLQDVLGGINSEARRTLYILLGLSSLIMTLSIIAGNRIAAPLNAMSRRAEEIAQGDFGRMVDLRGGDELGRLGRSMDHMALNLEARATENTNAIKALETLIEQIPDGIALLDPEGKAILTNKTIGEALTVLAGLGDRGEIVSIAGKPLNSYIVSEIGLEWITVSSGPGAKDTRHPPVHREFKVAARGLSADKRGFSGSVLIIREVTEEQKIRQMAYTQEKMAAVGQLAAGIAHDFNNLLTTIIGFSELLLDDQRLPPDMVMQIEAINTSGNRASDLVSQLMDFSRKSVSEPKSLEIKGAVAGFIRFMAGKLPGNIHLSQEAGTGPFNARVDPAKLRQVLTNLTLNAWDAMPEGGHVVFRISSESVRDGQTPPLPGIELDRWVLLSVTDDGKGIPEDILPHIFEPFYTTKRSAKGTGLGLAQAYGIIRQHGGYITVKSANKKTTFNIYLPESTDIPQPVAVKGNEPAMDIRAQGETILVVEDDKAVMNLVTAALKSRGYKVITAANGMEGLDTFKENPGMIDLIITDMMMPGMNGYEMGLKIREADNTAQIITISGYSPRSVTGLGEEELEAAGIVKWIPKPFEPNHLITEAAEALRKKPPGQGRT